MFSVSNNAGFIAMNSIPNSPTLAEGGISVTITSVELPPPQQSEDYLMVMSKLISDKSSAQIDFIAGFSKFHLNLTNRAEVADENSFISATISNKPYAAYGAVLPPMLKAPAASLRWLLKGDVHYFRQHQERFIAIAQVAGRAVFNALREVSYDPSTVYQELLVKSDVPDSDTPPYFIEFATKIEN
jgi:hypothetical protein